MAGGGGSATSGDGGCAAAPSINPFCLGPTPSPELILTPHCSDFVPSLSTGTLDWVGGEPACGTPDLVEHRFDAPAGLANGCGYELVIALPGLTFAGSGTYNLNAWWLSGNGPPRLIAAVLRREDETLPELAVGVREAGELVSRLSEPMTIQPLGPPCENCWKEDPAAEGLLAPALSVEDMPLACDVDPARPALLRCSENDRDWHAVIYCAPEASVEFPVVLGRAESLTR